MTPDMLNGGFEFTGALMIWVSIRRALIDQISRGVSSWSILFFTAWGYWNLYFYSHLNQPWSLAGAVCMVSSNSVWVSLLVFYQWRAYRRSILMMDERILNQFDA